MTMSAAGGVSSSVKNMAVRVVLNGPVYVLSTTLPVSGQSSSPPADHANVILLTQIEDDLL